MDQSVIIVSKCHICHELCNVRFANNSSVYHSISSFELHYRWHVQYLTGIAAQRFLVTRLFQDILQLQARKYYYSLNLKRKYLFVNE